MNKAIEKLLNLATSQDSKTQEEALVQISFILNKSNTIQCGDNDSEWFPSALHKIRLDEKEQAEVVSSLADLFVSGKCCTTALFATIGYATRVAAIGPLLKTIEHMESYINELDPRTIEQAMNSLRNMLAYPIDMSEPQHPKPVPVPEVAVQLRRRNVKPVLEKLAQANHPFYSEMATEALNMISTYGEPLADD